MEIVDIPKSKKRNRIMMIRMSHEEALWTIHSLSAQIAKKDCNADRYEKFCVDGTDFSIAVHTDRELEWLKTNRKTLIANPSSE